MKSKLEMDEEAGELESTLGFENFTQGAPRLGWLMNMSSVRKRCERSGAISDEVLFRCAALKVRLSFPAQGLFRDRESGKPLSCINCYFMCQVLAALPSLRAKHFRMMDNLQGAFPLTRGCEQFARRTGRRSGRRSNSRRTSSSPQRRAPALSSCLPQSSLLNSLALSLTAPPHLLLSERRRARGDLAAPPPLRGQDRERGGHRERGPRPGVTRCPPAAFPRCAAHSRSPLAIAPWLRFRKIAHRRCAAVSSPSAEKPPVRPPPEVCQGSPNRLSSDTTHSAPASASSSDAAHRASPQSA